MDTLFQNHEVASVFIARVFLGMLFFFQGYDAVFKVGISGVMQTIREPLAAKGVPALFISLGAWFTSYVELFGGFLLIIGFAKYYAMYMLGLNMLLASLAFGIIKPMWDMQFAFPRLALLIFLLIVPSEWDVLSVDYYWSIIRYFKHIY